jgi:receptor protein-tyrosine kinase/non-specific protein-tyrosine kinase
MSRIEKALEKATRLRENGDACERTVKKAGGEEITAIKEVSPYVVTLNDPASPISEEYRKLKSMVVKLTKQGGFKNAIMVTSSLGGEGKSVTAANLAVTLSQEYDHTVLLIDADIRKPSLHRYLNIIPEVGLADCLVDGLDIEAALLKAGTGKLTFLPAGNKDVKNPAELLSSQKMKKLLDGIKHRYSDRYIIIDTPPILSFAETFAISSMVDGILFVVREGVASIQSIRDALDILKDSFMLGIVYNDVSVDGLYGHYHYQYYYYGNKEPKG